MQTLPDSFIVGADDETYGFATAEEQQRVAVEARKWCEAVATFEVRNFEGTDGTTDNFAFDNADEVIAEIRARGELFAALRKLPIPNITFGPDDPIA